MLADHKLRFILLLLAGAMSGFLLLAELLPSLPTAALQVRVRLYVSKTTGIALYLNNLSVPPQPGTAIGGKTEMYRFPVPYSAITRIRVDVAEEPGVLIRLYDIAVTGQNGKAIAQFNGARLATWAHYNVTAPRASGGALVMTSTAVGADVDEFVNVSAPNKQLPAFIETLARDSRSPTTSLEIAFWAIACIAALLLVTDRTRRQIASATTALGAVVIAALVVTTSHAGPLLSPAQAVGGADFFAFSPLTNTHGIDAMYVMAVIAAGALVLLDVVRKRSHRPTTSNGERSDPRPRPAAPTTAIATVACLALAIAAFIPDLPATIAATKGQLYVPNWDANNLLAWTGFASRGLIPMNNFWYPYENLVYFRSSLVTGPALYFLYQVIELAGYCWVFWRLSGRRTTLTVLAEVGLIALSPLIGEFPRYGFAFMGVLAFAVLRNLSSAEPRRAARMFFALVVGVAALVEADLLAYLAVGGLCIMALELAAVARDRSGTLRHRLVVWLKKLGADLAGAALAVVPVLALTAARGQLGNMVRFYSHLGLLEAYSASTDPLLNGLKTAFSLDALVLWLPPLLLGGGVVLALAGRTRARTFATGLVGIGGASATLLTKDAIRPLTADLNLTLVLAALMTGVWVVALLLEDDVRPSWRAPVVGMAIGLFAAVATGTGGVSSLASRVAATPARLYDDVSMLAAPSAAERAAQAGRFNLEHFAQYPDATKLTQAVRPLLSGTAEGLYILGDDPIEYLLLHQRPPWQVNMYNTSPIGDQRKIVEWLERIRPRVVIFDGQDPQTFDGVPDTVRDPLVYQAVVAHYHPVHSVGLFVILERNGPQRPVAGPYWLRQLGSVIDLGAIPGAAAPIALNQPGTRTTPVLTVRTQGQSNGVPVSVPLRFGTSPVSVEFQPIAGHTEYQIPIDRVWPWALSHHVALRVAAGTGWTASLGRGALPSNQLY